jgi:type III secretion protein V
MKVDLGAARTAVLKMTRYNDIFLAILVVSIISLIVLPMPTPLVDGLIATNLGLAVTLIMLAMYIPSALSLSTFPSILLFTTLFRLALNITTTRLILLDADAGKIINTFGNFVVAGNFIVGGVIFLVITIVQFLVIAKGSERVAEVAARFTLDAMPGKQMSIDADLRAGVIDMDEAKRRRGNVERESQLYGAMDGAMKFVKGDAVAGIIITAINILGGIAVGVLQKGMEIDGAVQTFSILTIGDGLVSQIPALFISITAGIIVTRVSSEEPGHLGGEIGVQVLRQPKALVLGGVVILAFALVPGFPKMQFVVLGTFVGAVGFLIRRAAVPEGEEAKGFLPAMAPAGGKRAPGRAVEGEEFAVTVPLLIDVAASIQEAIRPRELNEELVKVRKALYFDLGVPFPGISLRFNDALDGGVYVILVQEVPMSQGRIAPGRLFVRETEENLRILGIEYETGGGFLPDLPTVWVDEGLRDRLDRAAIPFMEPTRILIYHLSFLLKRHAAEFIGLQETKYLMDRMEERYPELVRESQRVLPVQKIAEVFQRLVQEEISIRNLRTILQALIEWGQKEKDVILLTEYVRMSLGRYISYKYSAGRNILGVYLFDPDVEETVRKAIRQTTGGSYLALDPRAARDLVAAIRKEVGDLAGTAQKPVILTAMDVRRYVKKLIELEIPDLPVLSHQELDREITIQPLGRIVLQ